MKPPSARTKMRWILDGYQNSSARIITDPDRANKNNGIDSVEDEGYFSHDNAAHITLAWNHFDAMEKALRAVRDRLAPAYAVIDDDEIAESLGRAQYHIDEILKAIDTERGK